MNNTKTETKLIRQGEYIAEIDVTPIYSEKHCSSYISLEEAEKLDKLRLALQNNDLKTASQLAHIYRLTPVTLTA
ncbi:hypothetical protein Cyast_2359 [Cyanobacterium stanieri PCC 7202]|uniref:Uncharacterized protein n=1 Tax=Cyanobacterium stanieri (strain ATCC 29140 / PCC 7202) TaxID=292563 RepID=K9YMZ3_CYASC|nr:hypothetical protein Cyast_2359 [Cyanobacterium stanieri PCC 7202]